MNKGQLGAYMGLTAVTALVMSLLAGQLALILFPTLRDVAMIWYYAPRLAPILGLVGSGLALRQNPDSPRSPTFRCLLIGSLVGLIPGTFFTLLLMN